MNVVIHFSYAGKFANAGPFRLVVSPGRHYIVETTSIFLCRQSTPWVEL